MADAKMGHKKVKVQGDSPAHRVQIALTADARRLVPLNGGLSVYYFNPITNCTEHFKSNSVDFVEALRPACDLGLGPRIRQELEGFHAQWPKNRWDFVLSTLIEEGLVAA
jgi:hypothetical protein